MADAGDSGGGEGGFRGFDGLRNLLGQVHEIKDRIQQAQEALAKKRVEGASGGGMVVAVVNGRGELLELRIEKAVVDPNDIAMLQDLVIAAVNQATRNAREEMQNDLSKLTGGFNIPGFPGLF